MLLSILLTYYYFSYTIALQGFALICPFQIYKMKTRCFMWQPGLAMAIDVDNLLISSARAGQGYREYSLRAGFDNMIHWVQTFANIVCVHLYMPASQCTRNDELFHALWEQYKKDFLFEIVYCPKKIDPVTGKVVDNVDQHLIDHTRFLIPMLGRSVDYFCLTSGDLDYSPLLWWLKRERKKAIAFAVGSKSSFSKAYESMGLVSKHPSTGEDLVHLFKPKRPEIPRPSIRLGNPPILRRIPPRLGAQNG